METPRHATNFRWLLIAIVGLVLCTAAYVFTRPGGRVTQHQLRLLLPTVDLVDTEAVQRDYSELQYTSAADRELAFHVLVAKNWQERQLGSLASRRAAEDKEPVLLTALTPQDRSDALLEISYVHLQTAAALRQLMDGHARRLGAKILARQPGSFNNRQVEDALVRWRHPQLGPCLTRITLSRQGDLLFIVSGSAQESSYAAVRTVLGVAAVSFASLRSSSAVQPPQS